MHPPYCLESCGFTLCYPSTNDHYQHCTFLYGLKMAISYLAYQLLQMSKG